MSELCPVCGGADVEARGDYRANHPIFTGRKRAHCSSCDMVFATPMPGEAALDQYNANYFSTAHGGQPRSIVDTAFFSGIARLRIAYIERYLGTHGINASTVLELGPGPGFFARNWLERHPESTYIAFETDTSCHASLKEIGVHLVDDLNMAENVSPVDVVVMSHVLEHGSDPNKFLMHATRILRQGGALFIEVPCRDYEHKPIDEPHLLFFDKKPMYYLLNRLGFDEIVLTYHGQEISGLQSASALSSGWMGLRSKLIAMGLVTPFAWTRPGMEPLINPLERAAVAPFRAHRESSKPAWWLRAVARKGHDLAG